MGIALYRKYRSKNLREVVGQRHITDTLQNALNSGKISHAYLFTGPRGVGKTSVARILAHEVNGIPYEDESTHLDIIEIDAASNRRIDEIRDLREKVHIAPTSAKYKVYIIDEVHMLTREAFNALLKTLEEPPEHVVFILATTEAHKLPETIISRTQQYSFKPIEQSAALTHLRSIADQESLRITDEALEIIVNHADGSFRDSISMLDQISGVDDKEITASIVSLMLGVPNHDLIQNIVNTLATNDTTLLFETTLQLKEQGASATNTSQSIIEELRKSILNNSQNFPVSSAVKVMKSLLPLTGSSGSFEAIEIAFLDAYEYTDEKSLQNEVNLSTKNNRYSVKHEETKPEVKHEDGNTDVAEKEPAIEITIPDNTNTDEWTNILTALKGSHNTLYGVLRMAKAEVKEEEMILTFAFAFHKKQLNQNKNLDILHSVISDTLGRKLTITIKVVKPDKKPQKKTIKPKGEFDEALNNVSNIFGGAELLES